MIYFFLYPLLFVLLRLLLRVLGRLHSSGEANVPAHGGILYCPNHLSDADPPTVFVSVPRRAWFVGKSELFEIPVLGWFFAHFQGFPIKRDSADRAALRRIEALLKSGEPVVVFPEGRCSETGLLQRIQPGAALLSLRAGVPIIPIGLQNTNGVLPYGKLVPRYSPRSIEVTFGKPIRPQDYAQLSRGEAIAAITEALGLALARLTDQPPPPSAPSFPMPKA
ncbi:MAG: lysophospholipid acyltransferase family protein [Janthinobacterium lividum]